MLVGDWFKTDILYTDCSELLFSPVQLGESDGVRQLTKVDNRSMDGHRKNWAATNP